MSSLLSGIYERSVSEIFGFGIGTALGNALNPEAVALAQESWAIAPNLVLPIDVLARLALLERLTLEQGEQDAKQSGFNSDRFARAVEALSAPPSTGETLELLRRNRLADDAARQALLRGGLDSRYVDVYMSLAEVLLSPADLAMMRQQSFITEGEQIARSKLQGVNEKDAELLFQISGEPPGAEFMVELWRRGLVTEQQVRDAIVEGRIKLKWTDAVLASKQIPLSPAIAAEAVVRRRHLPKDPHYYAEAAGLSNEDFDAWTDMLGRPIAIGEALQLARRGEFTEAQFTDAVARSDVRTEYAPDLWKLRRVLPNLFSLRALIGVGAISDELAIKLATDLGYEPAVAHGIVDAAKHGKTAKTRDLAAAQIDALYESGLEAYDWAHAALVELGYDEQEANWHLMILDSRRILAALNSHLLRIHALYVGHKISKEEAQTDVDRLQISPEAKDLLFETWDNERAANVSVLTNAEVGQALKYSIITIDDAIARWMEHGYGLEDARIKAEIALKSPVNFGAASS